MAPGLACREVLLVKSSKDTRYAVNEVVSHTGERMQCLAIASLADIPPLLGQEAYDKVVLSLQYCCCHSCAYKVEATQTFLAYLCARHMLHVAPSVCRAWHGALVPFVMVVLVSFSLLVQIDVIGVDEAQFIQDVEFFTTKAADEQGKTLVLAGLDSDFMRYAGSGTSPVHLDSNLQAFMRCTGPGTLPVYLKVTGDHMKSRVEGLDLDSMRCKGPSTPMAHLGICGYTPVAGVQSI